MSLIHADPSYEALRQAWLAAAHHAKEMASEHGHGSPEATKAAEAMNAAWEALCLEHVSLCMARLVVRPQALGSANALAPQPS